MWELNLLARQTVENIAEFRDSDLYRDNNSSC